jgi:maleylpyruvate isomerase
MAIIEWLDEKWPSLPLLPTDLIERAQVRAMAQIIACDIHPLNNLRVLTVLREELELDETQIERWIARWIQEGFAALEILIERHGGGFAFGDTPGLVDCCLVPQVYAARRFNVGLTAYPRLCAAAERARELPSVKQAEPTSQPDAD